MKALEISLLLCMAIVSCVQFTAGILVFGYKPMEIGIGILVSWVILIIVCNILQIRRENEI